MTHGRFWAFATMFVVSLGLANAPIRVRALSSTPPPTRGFGTAAPNPVAPIVKQMKAVQTRLKEGNTGSETREIQQQVVRDLEKLIDAASRQSGSPNQGSGKSQSGEKSLTGEKSPQNSVNGSPPPSQAAQRGGAEGASAKAGGSAPGKHGGRRMAKPIQTKVALPGERSLLREVWGHLPPAMREHVRVDFSETVLPAYDELVRRYFEALLEESPHRAGTSPRANNSAPLSK
jgi:hypothetical protein